jgi:hypothetical protein
MEISDGPADLAEIIERTASDHELYAASVPPSSVEKIGDTYAFTLVWNFEDILPSFEYDSGTKTVLVDDVEAQVTFDSKLEADGDSSAISLETTGSDLSLERLQTALSEVTLSIERLSEVVEETERIEYVSLSGPETAAQWSSPEVRKTLFDEPRIYIRVSYSAPFHTSDPDGFFTESRFEHVSRLTTGDETVPVEIETTLFPNEKGDPIVDDFPVLAAGEWVHTSDYLVESTPVRKVDCAEQIGEVDLTGMLHEDGPTRATPPMD